MPSSVYLLPATTAAARALPIDVRRMFVDSFRRPGRSPELSALLAALADDLDGLDVREAAAFDELVLGAGSDV